MRIELPDDRIRFDGAVSLEERAGGVVPHRLDRRFEHQFPIETAVVETIPSGVRMVLETDADTVTVSCTPVRLTMGTITRPATFDVVVDGELVDSVAADFGHHLTVDLATGDIDFTEGEPGEVVLGGIPGGWTTVEIWLPQAAGLELRSVTVPHGASVRAATADERMRWVHHGSSISHGMEAGGPSRTWPAVAAAAAGCHLVNIGLAGQCQIDQFAARTIRDLAADRISLKLGINVVNGDTMTTRTFTSAVHGFLDTIREGHPGTPILVISPIICPALEEVPGPSVLTESGLFEAEGDPSDLAFGRLSVGRIRELLVELVDVRTLVGDAHLTYLDGRELFGEADLDDLPDGLHPNAAGYVRMGERFATHRFLAG